MGMPGHQEIELALMKLYEETGKESYKELAKYFIDVRGCGNRNYFLEEMKQKDVKRIFPELNDYRPEYSQSHLPVRKQRTAEGHAVRAVYMYAAMADIAAEYDDEELLGACETLWNNMVHRRMYVTGGIGSSGILERFTADYDLPNDYNYCESCASIGLAFFARRMMQITKKSKVCRGDGTGFVQYGSCRYCNGWKEFFLCQSVGSMATELYGANLQRACEKCKAKVVRSSMLPGQYFKNACVIGRIYLCL